MELVRRGDVLARKGAEGVYVVDVAYANLLDVSEEQIIQEANPWAVFGFATAMVYHGLTDLLPRAVHAIEFKAGEHLRRIPLGTAPEDWVDVALPHPRRPKKLDDTEVAWSEVRSDWDFGVEVAYSAGLPIYVTDVERTLLDALRSPDKCGGIAKVLRAWKGAEGGDLDRLVAYAERFGVQNLKQRVGFVLGRLGRTHPHLDRWRDGLQRGGSVKLLASEPYSEVYSAEWNLSLNVPPAALAALEGD